jgi:signal transduction histidine kinase
MSETNLCVLLIEDSPPDAELLVEMLGGEEKGLRVARADSMAQAESYLKESCDADVILLDLGLPDSDGLDSLDRAVRAAPHLPIVVLTGLEDEALGVEAVRKGAQDYLLKGQTSPALLVRMIRHAVERNRLSEARSQFLANVSHELRTPMNAILGMIDLALRDDLKPTARDCLNTARESADLLLGLLNNLLDSAKIESGNLELEVAPLSVYRVLEQTARVLAVRASEKGLAFHWHTPENLPQAVLGDKLRLRQVLLNLGGNAIKFTEQGEVTMTVRVESFTAEEARLEFAVRDTGVGIPPGDLERIFKPFAQAEASTARRFGGTGLGLSISANLVTMMGGRLWAESELGHGSTFYFTVSLPLAAELRASRADSQTHAEVASPLRVLLVEDNPASQKLATYILREAGHAAEVAENGEQALRLLAETSYDMILMDVQMPVMDGLTTTAVIRAREDGSRRVPIIAMTARAMKGDRERFLAAGMDGYISKPIDSGEMIALIARLTKNGAQAGKTAVTAQVCELGSDTPPAGVFDLPTALERCCQSWDMLGEMVDCLFADDEQLIPLMYEAVDRGDFDELSRLAHRLRGTLVCFAGTTVLDVATAVENESGSSGAARDAIRNLEKQVSSLKGYVAEYRKSNRASHEPAAERSAGLQLGDG